MTDERYNSLSDDEPQPKLTQSEWDAGWHWCADWDSLLVGPGMSELAYCSCFEQTDPRHKLCVDMRAAEDKRLAEYDAAHLVDDEAAGHISRISLDNPPKP